MTARLDQVVITLIGVVVACGTVSAWAAKAPLSPAELKKKASHIISGQVVGVSSKVQKSKNERATGVHRDRVFTIKLKVEAVSKGAGLKVGDEIDVEAWKPVSRVPPLPGLQGHKSIPKAGDTVTMYVGGEKEKVYEPILPNGIVIDQDNSSGHNHHSEETQQSNKPEAKTTLLDAVIARLLFGPGEDDFADNLTIPSDLEVAEPLETQGYSFGNSKDTFQQELVSAFDSPGIDDSTITADVPALLKLHQASPDVLRRFLATSPEWRVFKKRGSMFATRRWVICSKWQYELHGYYSRFDIHPAPGSSIPDFQTRFTIGFSGRPLFGVSRDATQLDAGETRSLTLSSGNRMHESRCIIQDEDLVIEVFEQSKSKERRLTKAALSHIEKELAPLVEKPGWETIRSILPAQSIKQGKPAFNLWSTLNPGIYDSEIWVNPGEPGMLYLKAFEITKGTPLSVSRLVERSNEWVGWSDNPDELFFSNTSFTIYEGDWGKPYAARFEVWFTPDSGAQDRKLTEKVFKIEGWQR